ncbi:hypothetical protein [Campylobacter helveticus]|uniref:hypothetical protein n=1 Tax=Campylobacter helveticus TaxID=28898 RepID=UPI001049D54E|nr:hypothetical protein [Campylobacter helveticus]MCR2060996.1 hypothetical protein [Campylobacter helveticus]MCR2067025.1 hypothetical protein [Campylobacter helveticus]QBL11591.1 hypothetical protein A0073_03435 [Campylobacter helveticus]TNH32431.1 hypothetical protein FDW46_09300 [Campylobacter helveticus]TNH34083.1 hypothetical protein FDW45_09250 [Campylobacter helveticus]
MSLYKKCEVCGSKINKLQNAWNLFSGKLEIKCKNVKSKYGVSSKIVEWIYAICFENLLTFPPIVILIVVYFGGYFSKYELFEMILCILITIFLTRKSISIILLLFCKFKRLENEG